MIIIIIIIASRWRIPRVKWNKIIMNKFDEKERKNLHDDNDSDVDVQEISDDGRIETR